jgi:tetratricopeptide (TPR) repeat protein
MSAPSLARVRELLGSGRYRQARQLCERLTDDGETPELVYLRGLAELLDGRMERAVQWLGRAARSLPGNPAVLSNLGEAQRREGSLERAEISLRKAISLQPDYGAAHYNLGCVLLERDEPQAALDEFTAAHSVEPDNPRYLTARADALRITGRVDRAIESYGQALVLDPGLAAAHSNLGLLLLLRGREEEAIEHCRQAVALAPDNGIMHMNLGRCLVRMERLDEAMDCYADALELMPDSAELCTQIGKVWLEVENLPQAEHWFTRARQADESHLEARVGLAAALREAKFHDEAIGQLETLLEEHPDVVSAYVELAETRWDSGDAEGAIANLHKALELAPHLAGLHAKIGHVLASAGAVDEALTCFRAALELNPRNVNALHGLGTTLRGELPKADLDDVVGLLGNPQYREGALSALNNCLAHVYDGRQDYARAAEHAKAANRQQWIHRSRRGWEYEPQEFTAQVDHIMREFEPAVFEKHRNSGNASPLPVFVVGMPRSGTTLTEQILACHPRVLGVGEREFAAQSGAFLMRARADGAAPGRLQDASARDIRSVADGYLDTLDRMRRLQKPGAEHVVDKCPDNYLLLGWLALLFPNVHIIHCRRDARDVAVSCWLTQFGRIRWACHEDHIAHRIGQYRRVMAHWRAVLPVPMLEIDYEETVSDTEAVARRMLEFIGLNWDPACLAPHRSDRLVRTASVTQVRKPVYRDSVARWQRYEFYLADLFRQIDAWTGTEYASTDKQNKPA